MTAAAVRANPLVARLKEAASHTVIYGVGSVLQTLLGFVLIPLYTRYYTTELYGVLTLLVLTGTLAGSVFCLGGSSALSRSYYDYGDPGERRVVVSTALSITLGGAIAQVVLGALFARRLSFALFGTGIYARHIVLALASSALTFVGGLLYVVLRFERRSTLVVTVNVLTLVITAVLILVLLVRLHLGVMAPILGTLIAQALACAVLLFACRSAIAPAISTRELNLQLRFGLMAVAVGVGYYVLDSLDRLFIAHYGSLSDVGVYSLGYKIGMLIHIVFIIPFSQIWAPMRMEYRQEPGSGELFKLALTYYWLAGLSATVCVSIFAREIITVAAGRADYVPAYRVVPFIMLAHLFYGVLNIVDFGVFVARRVDYYAYLFWGTLVVNAGLNFALVPRFGYIAAAWTTLASYVLLAGAMFVVSNRFYAFPFEARRIGTAVASGVAALIIGSVLSTTVSVGLILAKLALVGTLLVFWYVAVLTERERLRVRHPQLLLAARG